MEGEDAEHRADNTSPPPQTYHTPSNIFKQANAGDKRTALKKKWSHKWSICSCEVAGRGEAITMHLLQGVIERM